MKKQNSLKANKYQIGELKKLVNSNQTLKIQERKNKVIV